MINWRCYGGVGRAEPVEILEYHGETSDPGLFVVWGNGGLLTGVINKA